MDFEKAYDRVNREAMVAMMEKMNFGTKTMNMIKLLYKLRKQARYADIAEELL